MKNVLEFSQKKQRVEKISMLTCYDYSFARLMNKSPIDAILVGDSLAMTMHGRSDTLSASVELMSLHVEAVRRGAPDKFIVGDMPFLAHRGDLQHTMQAVKTIMQAGANAVKIEGIDGSESTLRHIVQSGVPVMGHLGLTPQSLHQFGGFRVQATDPEARDWLLQQALSVQTAGCFAVVLECVPSETAEYVTQHLDIPTIGIGAGPDTSGQILVLQDILGMNLDFRPRFVRSYLDGNELITQAFEKYHLDVMAKNFPNRNESFHLKHQYSPKGEVHESH